VMETPIPCVTKVNMLMEMTMPMLTVLIENTPWRK
jgi:hypothetical protein